MTTYVFRLQRYVCLSWNDDSADPTDHFYHIGMCNLVINHLHVVHVYTCVCMCIYVCACVYVCMYVCVCVHVCMCVYVCAYVFMCVGEWTK